VIQPPRQAERLIALGAYLAAEHVFQAQVTDLANERDAALARAVAAEQEVARLKDQFEPAEPTP
jgi:hypothetical protein